MPRRQRFGYAVACLIAALLLAVPIVHARLFPRPTHYASELDNFEFGSVGVEPAQGIPLLVWRAMPGLCMDGAARARNYRRFGFQWAPGRITPIGMPVETAIVPRVGINCALCHVGRVEAPGGAVLLPGAPNTSLDLQAYLRFMFACARSPRFTPDAVLAEDARLGYRLDAAHRLLYRRLIVPQVRQALATQARQLGFMDGQTAWGPGRTAGFQPAKVQVLGLPFDGTLDIVDIPPLWNLRNRGAGAYHWDGANTSLHEVVLNSGIGNGASPRSIQIATLDRVQAWAEAAPPARFPWPVDAARAAAGKAIFTRDCAGCHAAGGAKTGEVIPIAWLGTDRNRLDAMTPEAIAAFRAATAYRWRYTHFRKTGGYLAAPLDGIWARAPYLHNGSVPTLAALLSPADARPVTFGRGSPRYDPARVGFASEGGRRYDTRLPGNGNGGHAWGTALPPADKQALIEYLKTL